MPDQSENQRPVVIWGNLEALFGHDPALLVKLVEQFASDLPVQAAEVAHVITQNDLDLAYRASHRLAGAAAMFGAPRLADVCTQIELAARAGHSERFESLGALLIDETRLLQAELDNYSARR